MRLVRCNVAVAIAAAMVLTTSLVTTGASANALIPIAHQFAGNWQSGVKTAFLPNGRVLVLDPQGNTLDVMNANGTGQAIFSSLPGAATTDVTFDAGLGLVLVTGFNTTQGFVAGFTVSGSPVGVVDITSEFHYPIAITSVSDGSILVGANGHSTDGLEGLYHDTLTYSPGSPTQLTLASSLQIVSTPVDDVAVNSGDQAFVCSPSNLVEYNLFGLVDQVFAGTDNCSALAISGDRVLMERIATNALFTDQILSTSISTGTTTVLTSMGYIDAPGFKTGNFNSISVMPANVVGGMSGGLLLGELINNVVPNSIQRQFMPCLYQSDADATTASTTLVVQGGFSGVTRISSVAVDPTTGNPAYVDQFGGTLTETSATGASPSVKITGFRQSALSYITPGKFISSVVFDSVHHYLFALDAQKDVYRFPITGGAFPSSATLYKQRFVPVLNSGSGPLIPTAIGVNGANLWLGYLNMLYSEPELGGTPKVILKFTTGSTVGGIARTPSGNYLVAVDHSTSSTVDVVSPLGHLIRTLSMPAGFLAGTVTVDSLGHVFTIDASGRLSEVPYAGGVRGRVITSGSFTGVAAGAAGRLYLSTSTTVSATTAAALGIH